MKFYQLLVNYVNKNSHPRVLGRYWATDIYKIIKGQLTPENFFQQNPIVDIPSLGRIIDGMSNEAILKDIFDYNQVDFKYGDEVVREIPIDDEITLVVKPDFEFPDFVMEVKNPTKERDGIPEWYIYQLECEYRACLKPVKLGVFIHPFYLNLKDFTPDDERWQFIIKTLKQFHKQLKQHLKS